MTAKQDDYVEFSLSREFLEIAKNLQEGYEERKQLLQNMGEYNIPSDDDGTWLARDKVAYGAECYLRSGFDHIVEAVYNKQYSDAEKMLRYSHTMLETWIHTVKLRDNEI